MVMKKFKRNYPKTAKVIKYTGTALSVANQAYKMAQTVASIVNSEKKYHDTTVLQYPDSAASSTNVLSSMAQGDTNITRNGNSIALKSIHLRLDLQFDPTTAPNEVMRISLVLDKDNNSGSAPTYTDVYESLNVLAHRNKLTTGRFDVLKDFTVPCETNKATQFFEFYHAFPMMRNQNGNKTRSEHCYFDGATGNDYTRGHLFLIIVGNTATASTTSTVYGRARMRYYDN